MDIYGKVYIRVIRAQVIFIIIICFRDVSLVNYLISPYVKRNEWKN